VRRRTRNPLLANEGRAPRALVWVGNAAELFGAPAPSISKATESVWHGQEEVARERQQGQCGLWRHPSPQVKLLQWENVSGNDVEDGRRATQVLLIFMTELFLVLQFDCLARHDISPLSRLPLLLLVLPPAEGARGGHHHHAARKLLTTWKRELNT